LVTACSNAPPDFLERCENLQKLIGARFDVKIQIGHALFQNFIELTV
jgi:hypothetical protein